MRHGKTDAEVLERADARAVDPRINEEVLEGDGDDDGRRQRDREQHPVERCLRKDPHWNLHSLFHRRTTSPAVHRCPKLHIQAAMSSHGAYCHILRRKLNTENWVGYDVHQTTRFFRPGLPPGPAPRLYARRCA